MEERVTITKRTHRMLSAKVKFNQIREDLLEYGEKELDEHSYDGLDTALCSVDIALDNMIAMRINDMAYKTKGKMI